MTSRMPDGREVAIPLSPTRRRRTRPIRSSNPLSAQFEAGVKPGNGMLKAVFQLAGGSRGWSSSRSR